MELLTESGKYCIVTFSLITVILLVVRLNYDIGVAIDRIIKLFSWLDQPVQFCQPILFFCKNTGVGLLFSIHEPLNFRRILLSEVVVKSDLHRILELAPVGRAQNCQLVFGVEFGRSIVSLQGIYSWGKDLRCTNYSELIGRKTSLMLYRNLDRRDCYWKLLYLRRAR